MSAPQAKVPPAPSVAAVRIDVAPGELLDKITILKIKAENIADPDKLANVRHELETLTAARGAALPDSHALDRLTADLKAVNARLWAIEDAIRACERADDFGPAFIQLARDVYRTNDRRAAIKRRVNDLLGAAIVEEKSYTAY